VTFDRLAGPRSVRRRSVHLSEPSLFPGGVGNTQKDPKRFASLYNGVVEKIFDVLPDETWVYPGHGRDTTLGEQPHLAEWRTWLVTHRRVDAAR
jgi:glyoxylase-like metal-dependent hydrolase (beta-lactamase superfamily II)